jgi:aspartate/methionine/tyrosine aminotransferase
VEKILSVPGWVQGWTVIFDKHKILEQVKKNLEVMATIYLHTNTFIQHSMGKILGEVGIFTTKNMPLIQENYQKLSDRIKVPPTR